MTENWASRERNTNRLVGGIAEHLLAERSLTAAQLFGLCRLTWVNDDNDGPAASYIEKLKLPALTDIFGRSLDTSSLDAAGAGVAAILGNPDARDWVTANTGITRFYAAYRNTARTWFGTRRAAIERIVRSARAMHSDDDAIAIAELIADLDGIPLPSGTRAMAPGRAMTPLVFALDPNLRFPIVNGRPGIAILLGRHRVTTGRLPDQVRAMMSYLGQVGIRDAADLDAHATFGSIEWVKTRPVNPGGRAPLSVQPTGKGKLPLKDESDQETFGAESRGVRRRLHNSMTNALRKRFARYNPTEGRDDKGRFDILLDRANAQGDDLLIEVKSSAEDGPVRMAIGQLFAYHHHLRPTRKTALAVLLPCRPPEHILALLDSLSIGCLWFNEALTTLHSSTSSLRALADG